MILPINVLEALQIYKGWQNGVDEWGCKSIGPDDYEEALETFLIKR